MPVNIIVAYDEGRVIGNGPKIPWRLPEDMAHFKEVTEGCPVIMGRKTWESLPKKFRPLPNRTNIVVSLNQGYRSDPQPHFIARGVCCAINTAEIVCPGQETLWIIGGGQVYAEALQHDVVDNVYASEVAGKHEGDVFFPELDPEKWLATTLKHLDGFTVIRYERVRS
jgi:dihydrofolate reductase